MSDNRVSSPYSTGGGGTNFEHDVGALYMAALLTEKIPAGVQDGKVKKIQFQALHTGSLVDDIIITLDDKTQRIIAYQLKHRLTFSQSDNTFKDIIEDCWKTFAGQTRFSFNPEKDMLGIGIGIYSQSLDEHLQTLLEWARTSLTSKEFLSKVNMRGFSSDEKRNLIKIIANNMKFAKGDAITDDELWRFLRCLTIYYFDMKENGRDRKYCINSLLEIAEDEDVSKAKALFNTLHSIVGKYAQSGGSIDRESLIKEVRNYIVDKKDRKKEQEEFNPKAKKIVNENVFKLLATVSAKKDSIYSINLKVSDRRFANKLPYIRHAEKFLTIYRPNIDSQWQKIKQLVNQYNQNASEIIVTLQNSIREKMRDHYTGLTESDHFHLVSPNSYSMPSLLELTWNYCEQREQSEIVQFFSSNFTKLPHSLYGWALSRELRDFVRTAYYIITSSTEQFAEPHILIDILKSICHTEDITPHFHTLRSISKELDSLIEEFSYNIEDLSEEIELETAD